MARILAGGGEVSDLRELHYLEQLVTGEEFISEEPLDRARAEGLVRRLLAGVRDGYFNPEPAAIPASEVDEVLREVGRFTHSSIYSAATSYATRQAGKSVALDQTPRNLFYIDEILERIPTAKIICILRDPRDVVLSQKGKWKRRSLGADIPLREAIRSWSNYHPFVIAKLWRQAASATQRSSVRKEVIVVKFEALLGDTENTVRDICAHCGIAFEEDMLDVAQVGSSNQLDSKSAKGIDQSRTGAWVSGLSRAETAIVEDAAAPLLLDCGYEPSSVKSNVVTRGIWATALPLKMSLALALNLGRIRNLRAWASKRLRG